MIEIMEGTRQTITNGRKEKKKREKQGEAENADAFRRVRDRRMTLWKGERGGRKIMSLTIIARALSLSGHVRGDAPTQTDH